MGKFTQWEGKAEMFAKMGWTEDVMIKIGVVEVVIAHTNCVRRRDPARSVFGWGQEERKACMIESMGICNELEKQGKWIASSPLHSVTTATSVRVRDGRRQITDGPFAETTEQLGGYYIIDVDNLDEAIAIAAQLAPAKKGTVEIRPLFDLPELPQPNLGASL